MFVDGVKCTTAEMLNVKCGDEMLADAFLSFSSAKTKSYKTESITESLYTCR